MKSSRARRAPALEWPGGLCGNAVRITSVGSGMLLAENHCGICSFSDQCIVLSACSGCVEIHGRNLSLCQVRADALMVRGSIAAIKLPCGEAGSHEP